MCDRDHLSRECESDASASHGRARHAFDHVRQLDLDLSTGRVRRDRRGAGRCPPPARVGSTLCSNRSSCLHAGSSSRPPRHRRDVCAMSCGGVGLSPPDLACAATSSPRSEFEKIYRVHPTHWLISALVRLARRRLLVRGRLRAYTAVLAFLTGRNAFAATRWRVERRRAEVGATAWPNEVLRSAPSTLRRQGVDATALFRIERRRPREPPTFLAATAPRQTRRRAPGAVGRASPPGQRERTLRALPRRGDRRVDACSSKNETRGGLTRARGEGISRRRSTSQLKLNCIAKRWPYLRRTSFAISVSAYFMATAYLRKLALTWGGSFAMLVQRLGRQGAPVARVSAFCLARPSPSKGSRRRPSLGLLSCSSSALGSRRRPSLGVLSCLVVRFGGGGRVETPLSDSEGNLGISELPSGNSPRPLGC